MLATCSEFALAISITCGICYALLVPVRRQLAVKQIEGMETFYRLSQNSDLVGLIPEQNFYSEHYRSIFIFANLKIQFYYLFIYFFLGWIIQCQIRNLVRPGKRTKEGKKPSEREDNQNQSDKTKTYDSSIDNLTKVKSGRTIADNLSSVAQKVISMTETVGSKQKDKPSTSLPDDRVDKEDESSEKSFKSKDDVDFGSLSDEDFEGSDEKLLF